MTDRKIFAGHLNYFDVRRCGLYPHGADDSAAPADLDLSTTLKLIREWFQGKSYEETIPWDPSESGLNLARCYCHDIYADDETGEYLLVLWKSEAETNGSLWGIKKNSKPGKSGAIEYNNQRDGEEMIWGRPCYYWFVPRQNLVVSVKFENSVCDTALMQEWVERVVTHRIKHVGKQKITTPGGYIRFQFNGENDDARYLYNFKVNLKSLDTSNAEFARIASQVTHIVRRHTIRIDNAKTDKARWVQLLGEGIGYLKPQPNSATRQIETKIQARPTPREMEEIVERFSTENRKKGSWDNVGFGIEDNILWVDKYRLHDSISVFTDKSRVLTAVELHGKLAAQRERLLKAIETQKIQRRQVA